MEILYNATCRVDQYGLDGQATRSQGGRKPTNTDTDDAIEGINQQLKANLTTTLTVRLSLTKNLHKTKTRQYLFST